MKGKTNAVIGGGSDIKLAKLTIKLTATADESKLIGTSIIVKYGAIESTYSYTGYPLVLDILPYVDCTVTVASVSGFAIDASSKSIEDISPDIDNIITFTYTRGYITTVLIRQTTISDPDTMIETIVDEGGIEAIRANSHRYTGTYSNNTMKLKQLDDNDGTKYLDGSAAKLTTIGTDVWMKLPQFWYKCWPAVTGANSNTKSDIYMSVAYGIKPDNTYEEWKGDRLYGVYKSYVSSYKSYSVSGKKPTAFSYKPVADAYVRYSMSVMHFFDHCMLTRLFWIYYKTTNSNKIIGIGNYSGTYTTGVTNSMGMRDTSKTVNGDTAIINFWGLEDYWRRNAYEYMQHVYISSIDTFDEVDFEATASITGVNSYNYFVERTGLDIYSSFFSATELMESINKVFNIPRNGAASNSYTTNYCSALVGGTADIGQETLDAVLDEDEGITYRDFFYGHSLRRGNSDRGAGLSDTETYPEFDNGIADYDSWFAMSNTYSRLLYVGNYIIES